MDEGANTPEVRRHTDSTSVDATGGWSEGNAFYPGRPTAVLREQVTSRGVAMRRRESAEAKVATFVAR
jgi:hypothetical protein